MLEIITGYLVLSVILMIIFIEINKEQLYEQYLEIEKGSYDPFFYILSLKILLRHFIIYIF